MYKVLTLDFDGVILHSEPIHYEAYNAVLSKLGIALSQREYFAEYVGLSDKKLFPKLFKNKNYPLQPMQMDELIVQKIAVYNQLIEDMAVLPLINGLAEYVNNARQAFSKIAICSGASKSEVMIALNKLYQQKILPQFDVIVTAEDAQCGKPSPEGYLLTAHLLDVPPAQCMAIEDSPHGIDAAKRSWMYAVALTTTFDPSLLQQADVAVSDFVQLSSATVG